MVPARRKNPSFIGNTPQTVYAAEDGRKNRTKNENARDRSLWHLR
jgi:hypothetical protein